MATNSSIKNLPEDMRPLEKCQALGPAGLSDEELLALLLRGGIPGKNVVELARELLVRFGRGEGLRFLMTVTSSQLQEVPGIGKVKAAELLAVGELSRRISRAQARERIDLTNPSTIAAYFMEELTYLDKEHVVLAMFDTKLRLIGTEYISRGTVNCSPASPREIFRTALLAGAVRIVVLHNHPSGDPTPSREDIELTGRLASLGKELELPLLDHIIIGDHCYTSLRAKGLLGG